MEFYCPRCGFPVQGGSCELCGLDQFYDFEINRFQSLNGTRFELTLSFPDDPACREVLSWIHDGLKYGKTTGPVLRHFIFFENRFVHEIHRFLKAVKPSGHYHLLINGRPRPFMEELWLPMLELIPEETDR